MDLQTIFVNGTSQITINAKEDFITNLILVLIPLIATSIIGWKTIDYTRKQHIRSAMSDVFQILDETPHKSAEENIYNGYRNNTIMRDGRLNPDHLNPVTVVRRNYDKMGAMMFSNLIPKISYYRMFGVLTVVSYFVLKDVIEQERVNHKFFMAHFTNLAIDCFDFWNKQKETVKTQITDPNGAPITKEMLGEKIQLPK
jgi:hypothetical protein